MEYCKVWNRQKKIASRKVQFLVLCSFYSHINDLPGIITDTSQPVLFADDTSILISKPRPTEFINDINTVFGNINDWFNIKLLWLNFDKTGYVQFLKKNNHEINIHISYENKLITNTHSTNFLGLIIDSTFSWKNQIDKLMSKLSSASYAIRAVKSLMTQVSLRIIYISYFLSVMTYSIIFWGNSSYCSNIFKIQKIIISLDFRLPPRCWWNLWSSGLLHGVVG
jgi:hypothetical protein